MFRYVSGVMLFVFLLSMAVQYNDPDPFRWMFIYAVPAAFSYLAIRGVIHWLSIPVLFAFIWGLFYWMPGTPIDNPANLLTDVKMVNLGVEEWREDGGLAICAAWMAVLSIKWWLNHNSAAQPAVVEAPEA